MGKVLVLNSKTLELTEVELKTNTVKLEDLYKNIGCDSIEHVSGYNAELDKLHVGMWIDEEGKLKADWEKDISIAITKNGVEITEVLVGNVLFAIDGADGDTYCLSDEQIEKIKKQLRVGGIIIGNGIVRSTVILDYTR